MPSLWFVVPAHGRAQLARICLTQLRRTCDALKAEGVEATAVVIADDDNLDTAEQLGFGTVRRDNQFLSQRFNDGIQLACDPEFNPRPADYVMPCGSDDWIDWRILLTLPSPDRILGFKQLSFVREDGAAITESTVGYPGGCGMRVYPREIMALADYRPADEDRLRACDTSILTNLRMLHQERYSRDLLIAYGDQHPRQIVDWKSGENINGYADVAMWKRGEQDDPFAALGEVFPAEALDEMAAFYGVRQAVAA